MKLVVFGLSLSSAWGNGHATTWRSLLRAAAAQGTDILFLERDVPWYRDHRDLTDPAFCDLAFYRSLDDLSRWRGALAQADAVLLGSYVPQGVAVGALAFATARQAVHAFYDIDTPVTLRKLEAGDSEYLDPALAARFDLYFSFTGGKALSVLRHRYGVRRPLALYCSADPEIYAPHPQAARWDLSYLGTYAPDRQPAVAALLIEAARTLPHRRFALAGAQYPDDIDWPENIERIEHVAPPDHPSFYAQSKFTLNLTRADMVASGFSPSVRLFEAAGCAVPVISDVWRGLETVFEPGRDILLARETADVVTALETISAQQAAEIGLRARDKFLSAHTASHRAKQLLDAIEDVRRARRSGQDDTPGIRSLARPAA